jgi:hypothetical protein
MRTRQAAHPSGCSPATAICRVIAASPPQVPDPSVADVEVRGVVPLPEDAGSDAHTPIGGIVHHPDAGETARRPLYGIVIGLTPNPGHRVSAMTVPFELEWMGDAAAHHFRKARLSAAAG